MLYLSLEDTQRRIKDRLYNLTDSAPDNLYFAVTSGLIGGGLEEQITDFLTEHPATKLVIIDTLQKVRDSKGSAGKAGMYGNDYDDISSIKRIADGFNIAILLVHHLRKLQDSDDPFNDVSGSTGIIGAADTNFILRRKRSGNAATLLVSGRDVEYQELTLQFNDLVWELVERKNSEDIHKAELPKFLFRVVDFMECRTEWVGTATELLTEMRGSRRSRPIWSQSISASSPMRCWSRWASSTAPSAPAKAGSSNSCAVTAMTQMTPESLYKEIPVTTVIAVTNRKKGVNKCAAKTTGSMSV